MNEHHLPSFYSRTLVNGYSPASLLLFSTYHETDRLTNRPMSRTNPFAKHNHHHHHKPDTSEEAQARPVLPKRQFSGFKHHLQSFQRQTQGTGSAEEEKGGADAGIVQGCEHTKVPQHTLSTSASTPTFQPHTQSFAAPSTPHASSSSSSSSTSSTRWRLLWRGGLQVGHERYTLPGIAFCAKIRVPRTPAKAATTTAPITTGTTPGVDVDVEGKEMAMREQGSYFPSPIVAAAAVATTTTTITPISVTNGTNTIIPSNNVFTASTGGGGDGGGGTPSRPTTATTGGDTDLCLSLESMRGRKTLCVKGVERLRDGDLDGDEEEGGDGEEGGGEVHV
jgi:hypothetical protein